MGTYTYLYEGSLIGPAGLFRSENLLALLPAYANRLARTDVHYSDEGLQLLIRLGAGGPEATEAESSLVDALAGRLVDHFVGSWVEAGDRLGHLRQLTDDDLPVRAIANLERYAQRVCGAEIARLIGYLSAGRSVMRPDAPPKPVMPPEIRPGFLSPSEVVQVHSVLKDDAGRLLAAAQPRLERFADDQGYADVQRCLTIITPALAEAAAHREGVIAVFV